MSTTTDPDGRAPVTVPARRAWDRLRGPVATGLVVGAATAALALRDPHVPGSWGACPLLVLTGTWCAGCGALRATHDLAHLDVAAAWDMNPLWTVVAPLLVVGWVLWVVRAAQGLPVPRRLRGPWLPVTVLVVVLGYSVLRNVPALAPFLTP